MMKRALSIPLLLTLLIIAIGCGKTNDNSVRIDIGSKKFTEAVILGELAKQLAGQADVNAVHQRQLGGTRVLWNALKQGEIDIYPEYTGTIKGEILSEQNITTRKELKAALAAHGIVMSEPLGFNNTYAIGTKRELADRLGLESISGLNEYPELSFGFTNEFMDREDGYPGLRQTYNLVHTDVKGLDHDLAYRGLESGSIDVIDLYSTDAEIEYYDIKILKDDKRHFSDYEALFLYREDLAAKAPEALENILKLEGAIPESAMVAMNAKVKIDKQSEAATASAFLENKFGLTTSYDEVTFWERLYKNTLGHLVLVAISLFAAILLSIPLGIIAFKYKSIGHGVLSVVGIIQTIPSLALLVFMIPFFGIGEAPAIVALFLYSLLPIVRNTYLGFQDIPVNLRESAEVLGLSRKAILRKVELPLAASSIITGIKTSAVINVGTATLGALIGAGGYGQPILTGIRLDDIPLILEGAIPAALLAILVQSFFEGIEKIVVPKGLRIKNN